MTFLTRLLLGRGKRIVALNDAGYGEMMENDWLVGSGLTATIGCLRERVTLSPREAWVANHLGGDVPHAFGEWLDARTNRTSRDVAWRTPFYTSTRWLHY